MGREYLGRCPKLMLQFKPTTLGSHPIGFNGFLLLIGATEAEVAEALGVAVAMNAGAALVYSARALDAVKSVEIRI